LFTITPIEKLVFLYRGIRELEAIKKYADN